MAAVTTYLRADALRKYHPTTPMVNHFSVVLPSTAADTAEWITLMNVPAGYVVQNLIWTISATLGASCTIQARIGTTAISSASTAGSASTLVQSAFVAPSTSDAELNWLVAGADTTASATLTAQFTLSPAKSVTLS